MLLIQVLSFPHPRRGGYYWTFAVNFGAQSSNVSARIEVLEYLHMCCRVPGASFPALLPPPPLALLSARMPCIALSCNPGNTSLYPEPQKIHCSQLLSFWIQLERDEKDLRIHDTALKQHLPLSRPSQLSCLCPVVFTKVKHNLYSREQPDNVVNKF